MADSTFNTQSTGTDRQLLTTCRYVPSLRASAACEPAALIALTSALSLSSMPALSKISGPASSGFLSPSPGPLGENPRMPKTTPPQITRAIDEALKLKRKSWSGLAGRLKKNKQTVHYWKTSGQFPPEQLEAISDFTGIDLTRLRSLRFGMKMPDGRPVLSEDAVMIAEKYDRLPREARLLVHMWLDGLGAALSSKEFNPPKETH